MMMLKWKGPAYGAYDDRRLKMLLRTLPPCLVMLMRSDVDDAAESVLGLRVMESDCDLESSVKVFPAPPRPTR